VEYANYKPCLKALATPKLVDIICTQITQLTAEQAANFAKLTATAAQTHKKVST